MGITRKDEKIPEGDLPGNSEKAPDTRRVDGIVASVRDCLQLEGSEQVNTFNFRRLWINHKQNITEPFDEKAGHRSNPTTLPMKGLEQTNYSAQQLYARIEEVLNRNNGDVMKKILKELGNGLDVSQIVNPTLTMVFGGYEYAILRLQAEPGVDFTVAVSRNPASNEAMEKDYKVSAELRAYEARCRGIEEGSEVWKNPVGLGVLPHLHFEPGTADVPALLFSPTVPNAHGVYADPNCTFSAGGTIKLSGTFSGQEEVTVNTTSPDKELFYELARHQLHLATSGRVVYPSMDRADYIYVRDEKKLVLTCTHSPEFVEKTYQERDALGYMYAPDPIKDTYESPVDSCFVQTLQLIFLRHGRGFFYPAGVVVRALLDATQTLTPQERDQLIARLLNEQELIRLIPPTHHKGEEYTGLAQGRLKSFRAALFPEVRRLAKLARREASSKNQI